MNNIKKTVSSFLVLGLLASSGFFAVNALTRSFNTTKATAPTSLKRSAKSSVGGLSADDFSSEEEANYEELGASITQSTLTDTSQSLTVSFRSKTLAGFKTAIGNYIVEIDDDNYSGDENNPAPEGEAIKGVISKLKANDLLNDKEYMEDLINWDDERLFGKNKIIKHLKDQGIKEEVIAKAHFTPSNELKKAKGLIPKLDKKFSRYGYENKKQHIYQALLRQGYDYEIAKSALNLVKEDKPKVEKEKLLNDYQKIKKRYENKYEGYQLKQKIYSALATKGYKHSAIKNVLEEYAHENDF